VPIGAGLGGGSADAAATLRLLCRLWDVAPPESDLAEVAASLGSDVPFFLVGGEADVAGRGERLSPLPDAPARELLLLVPPFAIGTAEAYAAFDRLGGAGALPGRLEIASGGRFLGPNDLERAAVALRPEMRAYLDSARAAAAESAMTGSGSAIVLAGAAPGAREELARRHPEARVLACRTIGRETYRRFVDGAPPRA
jgi:4-diphosphocytidyl-2-C-methyl-D-erythritol kinase